MELNDGDEKTSCSQRLNLLDNLMSSEITEEEALLVNDAVEIYVKLLEKDISSIEESKEADSASEQLLHSMILNCAQAIDEDKSDKAYTLALQIQQIANVQGTLHERVAYYFVEGLIARITGTGSLLYNTFSQKYSSLQYFELSKGLADSCPNIEVLHYFCIQNILDVAEDAEYIHVIDYGISSGFQWMLLIKNLAQRARGPPKFKLSGIELKNYHCDCLFQEMEEQLASYAQNLGVPFEFHSLVEERWDNLTSASFSMSEGEVLIVNCNSRLRHVPKFARQKVLTSIRKMNPKVFILQTFNAACNSRNLVSKVHGALKFYTGFLGSVTTAAHEIRQFLEAYVTGLEILKLIACTKERLDGDGPESYKRWELRCLHAGFQQLQLPSRILDQVGLLVQGSYFSARQDGDCLLICWKEDALHALTIWRPNDV